ncbi:uncharacterized protein LOC124421178 [Lucilia cuprina]|nr:uncharacterized protein LOC124421178 [Lucilia cuprina]
MSFLNKIKTSQLPPIKNILNVAVQTARQHMPDKKDYEQPGGVSSSMAQPHHENQPNNTQAMYQGDETNYGSVDRPTELNPFRNPNGWADDGEAGEYKGEGYQTTSFVANEYDGFR